MEPLIALLWLLALGIAAQLFGVDSRPVEKPPQDR